MPFDILVKQNATVDDTLRLIINAVDVCSKSAFVQRLVSELHLSDPEESKHARIQRLFNYICRNAKYELDTPGTEEVWTPEKVIRERKFDCKKVSVFIASALKAAGGFDPILKHVYYAGTNGGLQDYTHIYVIVPDQQHYITVDPTNDCKYNSEVQSKKQTLYFLNGKKMDLHMMGRAPQSNAPAQPMNTSSFTSQVHNTACQLHNELDLASNCIPGSQTVSGSNQYFSFTNAEAVQHAFLKLNPLAIAGRGAFLGLLYLGKILANTPIKLNLARHLAFGWNKNPNGYRKLWWKYGGEADASAIQTALKKVVGGVIYGPPGPYSDRPWILTDATQGHGISGTIGQGPATVAAITAALPIIKLTIDFLKQNGVIKEGQTDPPAPAGSEPVTPPDGVIPPTPGTSAGSFAMHSINNVPDLLNFIKASAVIQLGASLHPALIIPTAIIITASFIYAIRNKILSV